MIKRATYLLLLSLALFSCNESSNNILPAPDTTPQTTLMYMTGTDLSYYFGNNITAAKSAIAENKLGYGRFVIFKHTSTTKANLVEYRYEGGACVADTLRSYDQITSLTHDALVEVLADVKELAPADTYNLIVSGHATGWVPKSRQTSTWTLSSASTKESEAINWGEMQGTSGVVTRYLGSNNDSLFDISELRESLEAAQTPLGYIIFDECFMSSIEALYDLRYLCDYIIASPCEIMGDGFPYATVIPELFSNYGTEVDYQGVCQAFYNYYSSYIYPSGCVALTVTAELDELVDIIRRINQSEVREVDPKDLQAYERLANPLFVDLEQYIMAKCADTSLTEEFVQQMAAAFPTECRLHTERFFANIGVSVSSSNNYEAYYTTIGYYSGVTTSAPSLLLTDEWAATNWAIDCSY